MSTTVIHHRWIRYACALALALCAVIGLTWLPRGVSAEARTQQPWVGHLCPISGRTSAVAVDGTSAYVGVGTQLIVVDITDPSARGYQVRIALPFHTDTSTDLLALLCYRTAKEGGDSALAPLQTIYNEVLARRPDLVDTYYQAFNFDCRDEEHPDGGPFYSRAAASVRAGKLSLRHNSGYAKSAQRHESCPRLTEAQREVMDRIDRLSFDEEIRFDVQLEEGDMLFLNNYQVMHARTAFEDWEEPERRRHLMRLWLATPGGRPVPQGLIERYGALGPGGRPAGIIVKDMTLTTPLEAE